MPYEWTDPELYLEHNGVRVYHTYKGGPGNEVRLSYWYTTDAGDCDAEGGSEYIFDVRELPNIPPEAFDAWQDSGAPEAELYREQIRYALDRGKLPLPPDNDGSTVPVESPVEQAVRLLEADGKEPADLAKTVHDYKVLEAVDLLNAGLRAQVEYLLSKGISLDTMFAMIAGSMKV